MEDENPREEIILLIACMDRRMNAPIADMAKEEKQTTGRNVQALRNAGADISNMESSLNEELSRYKVSEIWLLPHNDCGAMNDISQRKQGIGYEDTQRSEIAAKYTKTNLQDLCGENLEIQRKTLQKLVDKISPGTIIKAKLYNVSHAPPDAEKKAAIILDPSYIGYSELARRTGTSISSLYCIQYKGNESITSDVGLIPKALGINDITIFSTTETRAKATSLIEEIDKIARKGNLSLNVKLVDLVQQQVQHPQHRVKVKR